MGWWSHNGIVVVGLDDGGQRRAGRCVVVPVVREEGGRLRGNRSELQGWSNPDSWASHRFCAGLKLVGTLHAAIYQQTVQECGSVLFCAAKSGRAHMDVNQP